ncbi:hypothetical protein JY651_07630 [Pyxidicoccus parkwayensis]|uniref:Uncharacterized protein n=1 Tax=Pyxidicoccus parkwayensis TaxID=2813578 RepID=A0ABX7P2W6_9BACT|nr:hypothetical protein [Pyxidicoccus parkwaysis]QSQ24803.1 hypothetical protein JY651_07630 [Pyxidicoccus parkwaysis]
MEVTKLKTERPASESKPETDTSPKLTAVNATAESTATASTVAVVSLRLVNQSSVGAPQVVIVQGNAQGSSVIAWRVIEHLSPGWSHPFTYPLQTQVSVTDPWGNVSPALTVEPGQQVNVVMGTYGTELVLSSPPDSAPNVIGVVNDLSQGAIAVEVLKDGLAVARTSALYPQSHVVYELKPTISIGVASACTQGEPVGSASASEINTEISLKGIASADIVMSGGGGEGSSAQPFIFSLANVVMA